MDGMDKQLATEAFNLAAAKLPVMTRVVHRSEQSL
jgi:ribosomal protein L16/L10AE